MISYCVATRRRKIIYHSEQGAQNALEDARAALNRPRAKRRERRVYECPSCGFWHLTSRE